MPRKSKAARAAYQRKWRAANPAKVAAANKKHHETRGRSGDRLRRYGVTQEQFDQRLAQQNNRCSICGQPFSVVPDVDHDHATGKVRGLLCRHCNTGIGLFKDAVPVLQKAIAYIERANA